MTKPIALLITAYNRQEKLERTLKSLEPELHLLDIILVDDGSDPPISIEKFSHYPIHLIRLPENRGIVAAANAGLEYIYARDYEFIARLDSDDVAINQRFTKQLAFLRVHPDIGLLGSFFYRVSNMGKTLSNYALPLEDKDIRNAMHLNLMLWHSTVIMRLEIARENGFYDGRRKSEDYDFLWRMLEITKAANLPDFLVTYEVGAEEAFSTSRINRKAWVWSGLRIKLEHFNVCNIYAYLGIIVSLLEITHTYKCTAKIRKLITYRLFPHLLSPC